MRRCDVVSPPPVCTNVFARISTGLQYKACVYIHHTVRGSDEAVIPTLHSRVQYWLLFLATSLIPTMATPQRSYMTSQMTPPPQVTERAPPWFAKVWFFTNVLMPVNGVASTNMASVVLKVHACFLAHIPISQFLF